METVQIKSDNERIVLYIEDNKYWGTTFHNDGRVESVDDDVFNFFDMFMLSDNQTKLPDENNYQVVLDNETNFKHYFLNGKEDFVMLFKNNGEDALLYNDNDKKAEEPEVKCFRSKGKKIIASLKGFLMACLLLFSLNVALLSDLPVFREITKVIANEIVNPEDYSSEQILDLINSSSNLLPKEKEYLSNRKLIEDQLKYVNKNDYIKFMYRIKLNNIGIRKGTRSYYNPLLPNNLFIDDYDYDTFSNYQDDISHEFMHMLGITNEALAEIIRVEYFKGNNIDGYGDYPNIMKKLIEITGPEMWLEFDYSENFSPIEQSVRPFLSDTDYNDFRNLFHSNKISVNDSKDSRKEKLERLTELISTLYRNKYGKEITDDEVMNAIDSPWCVRYYFNDDLIDQEHSYYYKVYKTVPYDKSSRSINVDDYIKDDIEYQRLLVDRYVSNGGVIDETSNVPAYLQAMTSDDFVFSNDGIIFKGEKVELEPISVKFPKQQEGEMVWHQ